MNGDTFSEGCSCPWKGKHLVVQGSFDGPFLSDFCQRCGDDAAEVYGRLPALGEKVAAFSAAYPRASMNRLALGIKEAADRLEADKGAVRRAPRRAPYLGV